MLSVLQQAVTPTVAFALGTAALLIAGLLLWLAGQRHPSGAIDRLLGWRLDRRHYRLYRDLVLETDVGEVFIDNLVLSRFGIFVIHAERLGGRISGGADARAWLRRRGGRSRHFVNPLQQNQERLGRLQLVLAQEREVYDALVVFPDRTRFVTAMPDNVLRRGELLRWIRANTQPLYDDDGLKALEKLIAAARLTPTARRRRRRYQAAQDVAAQERPTATAAKPAADAPAAGGGWGLLAAGSAAGVLAAAAFWRVDWPEPWRAAWHGQTLAEYRDAQAQEAEQAARRRKDFAWQQFYRPPAQCVAPEDEAVRVICANFYVASRRRFETAWAESGGTPEAGGWVDPGPVASTPAPGQAPSAPAGAEFAASDEGSVAGESAAARLQVGSRPQLQPSAAAGTADGVGGDVADTAQARESGRADRDGGAGADAGADAEQIVLTYPLDAAQCGRVFESCNANVQGCVSLYLPAQAMICMGTNCVKDSYAASIALRQAGIRFIQRPIVDPEMPVACVGYDTALGGNEAGAACLQFYLGEHYQVQPAGRFGCRGGDRPYAVYAYEQ